MDFSGLDLLHLPVVIVDEDFNIIYANRKAKERAIKPEARKCFEFNFGLKKPCWQLKGNLCPLKLILENDVEIGIAYNSYLTEKGLKKLLIKASKNEFGLYTEVIFEDGELTDERKKASEFKISKTELRNLIQNLLEEGKVFYVTLLSIKRLKSINQFFGVEVGDTIISSVERKLDELAEKFGFYYAKFTGANYILLNPREQEMPYEAEKRFFEELGEIRGAVPVPARPAISAVSAEISPLIVRNAEEVLRIMTYAERYNYEDKHVLLTGENIDEILKHLGIRTRVVSTLEEILNKNLIELFFQPIVSFKTGEVDHLEALIRIKQDNGYIPVGNYIDLIYELNLITDFNIKVLEKLQEYLPRLKEIGKSVFINVSSIDLKRAPFRRKLVETLIAFSEKELPLGIELTEQAIFEDYEFLEFLNQSFGIKFAIDDFGTGYSSLKMIIDMFSKRLINAIKLDCSLVKSFLSSEGARALITSIVEFTKMFGLETVAECVERREQVEVLKGLGITHGQGWYFYKALPLEKLPEVVNKPVKL